MTESNLSPPGPAKRLGPLVITVLVLVLLVLHQDNWLWDDDRLVMGFMPIGLVWHACISIGATLTWLLATVIAWPVDAETKSSEHAGGAK